MNKFWLFVIIPVSILLIFSFMLAHDQIVKTIKAHDDIIKIIQSQKDCSFLNDFFGDSKYKWLKNDIDNEVIKRMELLKCQ